MSLAELEREDARLNRVLKGAEAPRPNTEEDDPWHLLWRTGKLMSEIGRRKAIERQQTQPARVRSIEDAKCRDE